MQCSQSRHGLHAATHDDSPSVLFELLGHRLRLAARILRQDGVIAYPTEAVYGLGCNPWARDAVERILTIKCRDMDKGLILIAANVEQLRPFVKELTPARMAEIRATWPGPNTWLLPARDEVPRWLRGRFETLAVRVTAHPIAAALCRAFGGALVSTSANRANHPPARTALQVRLRLGAELDAVLGGPCGGCDRPSTIRDGRTGQVLRA